MVPGSQTFLGPINGVDLGEDVVDLFLTDGLQDTNSFTGKTVIGKVLCMG